MAATPLHGGRSTWWPMTPASLKPVLPCVPFATPPSPGSSPEPPATASTCPSHAGFPNAGPGSLSFSSLSLGPIPPCPWLELPIFPHPLPNSQLRTQTYTSSVTSCVFLGFSEPHLAKLHAWCYGRRVPSPNSFVEARTPSTSARDCIWRRGSLKW